MLAFLIGATWIGAEWSTRSLVALLFWVPQRMKVMGVKLVVLVVASALFGVAVQALWLAMAGILNAAAGTDDALPPGSGATCCPPRAEPCCWPCSPP